MPPKKKEEVKEKILLGRPSNNLKMGIVGLPNVGKSTFFNVLTNSSAPAENYPFCTIDPEEARVTVPDTRMDWLVSQYKPKSIVPAVLTVMDIAGLVKGAAEGQGLGNAFLSHVKAVDGIFHMVRAFDGTDIAHVEGDVDPIRDLEIIHEELRLKDVEFLSKRKAEFEKKGVQKGNNKEMKEEYEMLLKIIEFVDEKKMDARFGDWNNKEIEFLNTLYLITAKPVVYLVNLSEADYIRKKNKWLPKIKQWVDERGGGFASAMIPFSVELELKVSTMGAEEKAEYLKKIEVASSLPKIIVTGYKTLQLIYYFTAGEDEVRAWTIRNGTKAPQAAGVIHTDFERGFIMAEVMRYEDLHEAGNEANCKASGKYLQKGKEYVVQDGDVILFKFNVTTQPKKK